MSMLKKMIFIGLVLGTATTVFGDVLSDLTAQIAEKTKEKEQFEASLIDLQKMLDQKSKDGSPAQQISQIQLSIQGISEQVAATSKVIQELNDKLSVVKAQPVAAAS